MTAPRNAHPGPARAFAAEFARATGRSVEMIGRDLARAWVKADYVDYLERELVTARAFVPALTKPKEAPDGSTDV